MSASNFQLLIKPSGADCNLKCEYCFYLATDGMYAHPGPHRMSDQVLSEMIRQALAVRMPQTIFGWQGGEPTLCGLDFFRRAVHHMQHFGRGGQSVGNGLQTNGVLIDEQWADFLAKYQFLVGVSIDGPPDLHDHYRVNNAGRGNHARAVRGAHLLEQRGVPVNILSVVNDRSRAAQVYSYLRGEGFRHLQFIPCVEKEADGGISPFSVSPAGFGRFLCELFDLWIQDDYHNVCIRMFDNVLTQLVEGRSAMCIFDKRCDQYVVVEYNGDVYPCDFFVQQERRLGNLLEQPLQSFFETARHNEFASMKAQLAEQCLQCRYLSLCQGGCPKYRAIRADTVNVPTYFCESYLMFFDHTLDRFKILADRIRAERPARRLVQLSVSAKGRSPAPVSGKPTRPVGRNRPCPCGSGRKYKHCCAAARASR